MFFLFSVDKEMICPMFRELDNEIDIYCFIFD